MRQLLILGGGTAGTMVANRLRRRLPRDEWAITVIDRDDSHHYQPGYLFIPFGTYTREHVVRSRHAFIHDGIELRYDEIQRVLPDEKAVVLAGDRRLTYDQLVIASGCAPRPDLTPGLAEALAADPATRTVHDFYTLDGALALHPALERFTGGRLVVHVNEIPIKCPVAPLEFVFLADSSFRTRGLRDAVELVFVTPLDGAFTKPTCNRALGHLLADRGITLETDFATERVEADERGGSLFSYDEREVPFDLLVTVPINAGAGFVAESGLGDDLGYVPVDKHTLLATGYDDIWALGDASDIPTSKAGSVAHFAVEVFEKNFVEHIAGRPMRESFDGHANCFIESGNGKALLIDFNYDTEPLPGTFPVPRIGPLKLLTETRANHAAKLAFRHVYWNVLLPGRPLPIPAAMSPKGKDFASALVTAPAHGPGVPVPTGLGEPAVPVPAGLGAPGVPLAEDATPARSGAPIVPDF